MKRSHLTYFAVGLSFLLLTVCVFARQAGGGYHLLKKTFLGAAD